MGRQQLVAWVAAVALCACASQKEIEDNEPDTDDTVLPTDEDGDGIPDAEEGRAESKDTDGDGIPDFIDLDSDNDGIPDSVEIGDDDLATPPADSDHDQIPNHLDTDSDGNGIPDELEGVGDIDGDGRANYWDFDDDGDFISDIIEIGPDPNQPRDTDGDTTWDFWDDDSDNDSIPDRVESTGDSDGDDLPAYRDLDSDNDCRLDAAEAGDSDPATPPANSDDDFFPDFVDTDSDNDAVLDTQEDKNCNGVHDPAANETSATSADTDGDGSSDLIEVTAGTDANDAGDNPTARGDFVFVVPYQEPPSPATSDLDFKTDLTIVDLYVLIDRSGSMEDEITSVRDNLQTVIDNLTCPPLGSGDPASCIANLWSGAGTIGYAGSGADAYAHHLDLQPNPALTGPSLSTDEPSGCCDEILTQSLWSTCTGGGASDAGCSLGSYPARDTCLGSPAGESGVGFPCFRPNALPVILFSTDESISEGPSTANCPDVPTTIAAANTIGAKVIGIQGESDDEDVKTALTTELGQLATGTGAVDANNGNAPLVFDGTNAAAAGAIQSAVQTLRDGVPLDLSATALDDPGDGVDAVGSFVDRLETLQLGTPLCPDGFNVVDTNADTYPDQYTAVINGSQVCWRLTAKPNTTVEPATVAKLYRADVQVLGDGVTLLDGRKVYFLVPPVQPDIIVD